MSSDSREFLPCGQSCSRSLDKHKNLPARNPDGFHRPFLDRRPYHGLVPFHGPILDRRPTLVLFHLQMAFKPPPREIWRYRKRAFGSFARPSI